jgi:hypothetical protein
MELPSEIVDCGHPFFRRSAQPVLDIVPDEPGIPQTPLDYNLPDHAAMLSQVAIQ